MDCIFCKKELFEIILEGRLSYAIFDAYPVNPGHMLLIPNRHFSSFFSLTEEEILDIFELLGECKTLLQESHAPSGYNMGINDGQVAGQSIMHVHFHLIPRYTNDVQNPWGGVRNLKPNLVPYYRNTMQ